MDVSGLFGQIKAIRAKDLSHSLSSIKNWFNH
jgi:hypothetical protein